ALLRWLLPPQRAARARWELYPQVSRERSFSLPISVFRTTWRTTGTGRSVYTFPSLKLGLPFLWGVDVRPFPELPDQADLLEEGFVAGCLVQNVHRIQSQCQRTRSLIRGSRDKARDS